MKHCPERVHRFIESNRIADKLPYNEIHYPIDVREIASVFKIVRLCSEKSVPPHVLSISMNGPPSRTAEARVTVDFKYLPAAVFSDPDLWSSKALMQSAAEHYANWKSNL